MRVVTGPGGQVPKWKLFDNGREVYQKRNSQPTMALVKESFSGVDFEATTTVVHMVDDDQFGLIFSYQVCVDLCMYHFNCCNVHILDWHFLSTQVLLAVEDFF